MGRLIVALIIFALAVAVLKMVILAAIIAGLIFRTQATVGLLMIGGLLTLLQTHPAIGFTLLAVVIIAGIAMAAGKTAAAETDAPVTGSELPPKLTEPVPTPLE